nr:MAG TPA: Replication initiation and membrane attachment [Caudoviricetes sp.]
MDYIRQMGGFIGRSAAVSLSASSYALYLQLFGINNKRRWAEWFEASNAHLETVTGLTSKTIQKARQELIEKGFISVRFGDRRIPTKYHIVCLGEKLPYNGGLEESLGEVIGEVIGEKFPQKDPAEPTASMDSELPKTKTKTKTNNNKQQQQYIPRACAREDEHPQPHSRDKPDEESFGRIVRMYEDNIHPLTGMIDRDILSDLCSSYPENWIAEAITEAVKSNVRRIRYIEAILESWKRDGFKTQRKTKGAVTSGTGEGDHSADVSAAETPWIQQLREWEERKRTSPRPWDVQPPAGGNRDAPGGDHTDRGRAG